MGSRTRPSRGKGRRAARPATLLAAAAAALPDYLPAQRWFGGKGRVITGVTPLDAAPVTDANGVLALFRVDFATGEPHTYLVPLLALRRGRPGIGDALEDPRFCEALVKQMRAGGTLAGEQGMFRFQATEALAEISPELPGDIRRITTEQSHSSIVFGDRAILKVFRKLESGPSPELELTEFLTRAAGFREAPQLAGFIVYEAPGEPPIAVGTLEEFVASQGDAWTAWQTRLDEYYAAAGNGTAGGAPDPAFARTLAAADAIEARALGAVTGRLHKALASAPPGSPLAPEPIDTADLQAWQAGMQQRLEDAMPVLAGALDGLPTDARALARHVLEGVPGLREALGALQALGAEAVMKIRVHGDYHLGQILKTRDGFVILDFEGEPARPLAERRAKQCVLKDVAGMLRSFAYAAQAALRRAIEAVPEDLGLADRLAPWAEIWEEGVRNAFLEGYLDETRARGASFLPERREVLDAVLRVFELDKALYELHYEITRRPGWIRIPLEGLRRAVTAAPRPAPALLRPGVGPFTFVSCLELREWVGARAEDERQLAELIEQVPLDCIYFHTHAFFLRHKFVAGMYPNDFATWVALNVRDQVLGERLAMVDPAEFPDLQALREELVAVIDDHLRTLQIVPRAVAAEPFDFVRSRIVEIPTSVRAETLAEFRQALLEVDASAIYYHLVEARLRLGRAQNDFAAWLERGLGLSGLAARVRAINPYVGSLERTRARLIQLCDEALAEGAGQ